MVKGFRSILAKFVVFGVISLALLMLLYNTMINGLPSSARTYDAMFTNVSGLSQGDDVRVAGVRVGKVSDIAVVPGKGAKVVFELIDNQPILSNTGIVMRYQNLLGQRYLSLVQPTDRGTVLPHGATIPIARTSPGFDLTALLNGFRPLLDNLEPADVNKLTSSLISVLQGEGGTVSQLLQQTGELTSYVADRDQIIGEVLHNLAPVLDDMAGQGNELSASVKELRALMTGLAKDRVQIGQSISGLSTLISSTSQLLGQMRQPLVLDAHLFREVSQTLAAQRFQFSKALQSFGLAFSALGRATSYQNGVNVYLCTLWATTALGEINTSGKPSGGPWSEACK